MERSINKYISDSGFCSRREADKYIEQARVCINDEIAMKGNRVNPGDIVTVDGEKIKTKTQTVYIALNKPKGITCTSDRQDKTNIIDFVNYKQRIFPVGRLDKLSDGLIFLTNDGDIVNKILRAGNQHEKEYRVIVDKPIEGDFLKKMASGVKILNTLTQKCTVVQEAKNGFKIILKQGLNRQIRRMCESLGYKVLKLTRTRIMNITLSGIGPGKWRYFTPAEIKTITNMVSDSSKTQEASSYDDGMNE
ncbi:MAG TPA: 23S rRNA pseudouridine(2604) synthase RluF [Saprospiraceae bacterium]|nr:23S rRNA pseudouridine(2604) synthase RluF [Saprospiraceae bacterium]